MARDWRRAVLAVFAAAMLGGACAPDALAQSADEDEAQAETKAAETKAKKKQDPAEAQRVIESALKQLQAGKAEQAVQAVSAAVAGGNLPPAVLAKALYVRGAAHRRQGRPAQAISDLTSALWLRGGLGGDEREEAVKEKAQAYADAGLADPGESRAPKTKATDSGSNWLSGIFGGGSPQEPPSPPPAPKVSAAPAERVEPPPSPAPKASAPKAAVGAAWTSKTEVEETPPSAPPPKAGPPKIAQAAPPPAPSAKKAEGRYLVQLAAKRTEAEALALAAKAKREHASLLGSRGQSVDRAVFGNMGAFYRVRFGPFATAQETQSVCTKLQGSGIDCLPVNR